MIKLAFIDLGSRLVQYFVEVSKVLEPEIQAYFFCTKQKSWSICEQSGFPTFPEKISHTDTISIPENIKNQILNDKILADNSDATKLERKINWLYPSLDSFLKQQQIDAIFLWNGSGLAAGISVFLARKNNLKTLFGENGYFYNTMQLDPEGVNQASSITNRIEIEYQAASIEGTKLQQLRSIINAYRNNITPQYTHLKKKISPSLPARISDELSNFFEKDFFKSRASNKTIPSTLDKLPKNYIFIPFQVVKDSQLLLYSPLVGSDMELFLSSCHAAAKTVARDYKIVVKLHPADVDNIDYSDMMERYPDVIFLKDYPSNQLIQSASLVITINSTIGVEALIHGKPVITMGENFYNVPQVVHHLKALSDLPQTIKTALSSPPDKEKTQQLLYYLYHCYFTHGSWKDFSQQSISAVAAKTSSLLISS